MPIRLFAALFVAAHFFARHVVAFLPRTQYRQSVSFLPADKTEETLTVASQEIIKVDVQSVLKQVFDEFKELTACLGLALDGVLKPAASATAETLVLLCDQIDDVAENDANRLVMNRYLSLRKRALEFQRYELLVNMMQSDYEAYVATASFLSPSRIPRLQLPNVQDIPLDKDRMPVSSPTVTENGVELVADCALDEMVYQDSILDKILLGIFRNLVKQNTGGITSDKEGIEGLLEQGRTFMLQEGQTPEAQHQMVYNTLGGLMTPILPPFYRIFMSGIVPKWETPIDGKQLGPWFYAPWLTALVTPTFFQFLVGPSYPNRRRDGKPGGLLVEKCKFLQESGCKGLCLHQCKIPAQEFFQNELGLPLTVRPNFVTQECQWSFGEVPLPVSQDPSFPRGCLVGCESRKALTGRYSDGSGSTRTTTSATLCN